MLTKLKKVEEKWGGSNNLIDQWLDHRRKLLVQYCKIAGLPPYDKEERSLPDFLPLQRFCNYLVDYVSEGHFEIYNQVLTICQQYMNNPDFQSANLSNETFDKIKQTTDIALDFNDKYCEVNDDHELLTLDKDLEELMHGMETRFQLEDGLVEVLFDISNENTLEQTD